MTATAERALADDIDTLSRLLVTHPIDRAELAAVLDRIAGEVNQHRRELASEGGLLDEDAKIDRPGLARHEDRLHDDLIVLRSEAQALAADVASADPDAEEHLRAEGEDLAGPPQGPARPRIGPRSSRASTPTSGPAINRGRDGGRSTGRSVPAPPYHLRETRPFRGAFPLIRSPWILLALSFPAVAAPPKPLVSGLKNPESVAVGLDGRIYVTVIGEFDKDGDGAVVVIDGRQGRPVRRRARRPQGHRRLQGQSLRRRQGPRVCGSTARARSTVFAAAEAFPTQPLFLNDIAVDEKRHAVRQRLRRPEGQRRGDLPHRPEGQGHAGRRRGKKNPALKTPNGLLHDSLDAPARSSTSASGELHRVKHRRRHDREGRRRASAAATASSGTATAGCSSATGRTARSSSSPGPGEKPVLLAEGFQAAADICLDPTSKSHPRARHEGRHADRHARPGARGRGRRDAAAAEAGRRLPEPRSGPAGSARPTRASRSPLRPIVLTHAGDGANRVFVATQHGVIHVFPNDQKATKTKVFLDIQDKVRLRGQRERGGLPRPGVPSEVQGERRVLRLLHRRRSRS